MSEVVEGLDGSKRDRIRALREAGRFFWVDLSASETRRSDLGEVLGIPEPALQALLSLGDGHPAAHRFYADGQQVVFAIGSYLGSDQHREGTHYRLQALEVRVLVSGDYLLTVYQERVSLPALLAPYTPEGRSEQYPTRTPRTPLGALPNLAPAQHTYPN